MRIRSLLLSVSLSLPGALGAGLCACGGSAEAPKAPAPAKVTWTRADGTQEATDDAPAADAEPASEAPAAGDSKHPGEVDLDELAAQKEAQAAAKKGAAKPAAKPAPKEAPVPDPPAPPAPVAAEVQPEPEPPAAEEPAAPVPLGSEMRAAVKGKEKPSPPGKKPPPKKAATKPAAAETAATAFTGPNPCRTTRFSVPRVQEACAANGRAGAKGVMKDAIGKALAAGASLKCGDCHAEQKDYTLKKDAVAQLKKWLGP